MNVLYIIMNIYFFQEARKAAVRPLLLGIVEDFSNCKEFKEILTSIISQNNPFSLILSRTFGRESVVDLMLETFGLHSVDLTCEVLEMMGRSHIIRLWLSNSFCEGKTKIIKQIKRYSYMSKI